MTENNGNIVLIGFMGAGKTTVGRKAARIMKYDFYDSDDIIKQEFSMSISNIFAEYGEKVFRDAERKVLKRLSKLERAVIATGGGAVLNPQNMEELRESGIIVLLKALPSTVLCNISKDNTNDRPLLKHDDVLERITKIMKEREILYECYDYMIKTDYLTVDMVIGRLLEIAAYDTAIKGEHGRNTLEKNCEVYVP